MTAPEPINTAKMGIPQTQEARRAYRELIVPSPD